MIITNPLACPQNHACPAVRRCPAEAIVQDDIYSAPRIEQEPVHRMRRLQPGLPRVHPGRRPSGGVLMAKVDLVCSACKHAFQSDGRQPPQGRGDALS